MRESSIENRLGVEIKKLRGKSWKFVSPGINGVPDRLILLPGGRIYFVELKAPGKKMSPIQEHRAKELRKLGFDVRCIDSIEGVKEMIKNEICTT